MNVPYYALSGSAVSQHETIRQGRSLQYADGRRTETELYLSPNHREVSEGGAKEL